MNKAAQDQAGRSYWNQAWGATPLPRLWRIDSQDIEAQIERSLFEFMSEAFTSLGPTTQNRRLIEVGCARSAVLPLFATRLGFQVAGLDYSPNGCEQAILILQREHVNAEIYCLDVFDLPDDLVERFDVVVSFGLIEHFPDTLAIVTALARLLRSGGLMFTNIPNMCGTIGWVQKILDRAVFDIHVPLTDTSVRQAHNEAGLEILECSYFLSTGFGVVNLNTIRPRSTEWWIKRIVLAGLARASMIVWWYERRFGRLPVSQRFSPYVNCLARKPADMSAPS